MLALSHSLFGAHVLEEYFLNTSYFFNMAWVYEFTILAAAAIMSVAVAALTYYRHR
ncbi:MAG TPA: hypothetical protein VFE98_09435 [Candidatus Bathyarchaeia archaeon]|nr:hypothetical protein [Candidatus Bathyarchaeia archaeon]